jgi:uncharacterized protein (TIGR02996 family)
MESVLSLNRSEQALLANVADTPRADAPRLVYADWLDEHQEPERAAFIRAHIAAQRQTNPTARIQAADLQATYERQWLKVALPDVAAWRWRCGLVDAITVHSLAALVQLAPWLAQQPVRQLRLELPADEVLDLRGIDWLLKALHGTHITALAGSALRLTPERFERLLQHPWQRLDLAGQVRPGQARGLLQVLARKRGARLRHLNLNTCGVTDADVLRGAPAFTPLRTLRLANNPLTDVGSRALVLAAPQLRRLDLNRTHLTTASVRWLPRLRQLRTLHISGTLIHGAAWGTASIATQLTALSAGNCDWTDTHLAQFLARREGPALLALNLANNRLTPAALGIVAAAPRLNGIRRLNLSGQPLGAGEWWRFWAAPTLQDLTRLEIADVGLTDSALLAWADADGLPMLRRLNRVVAQLCRSRTHPLIGFSVMPLGRS